MEESRAKPCRNGSPRQGTACHLFRDGTTANQLSDCLQKRPCETVYVYCRAHLPSVVRLLSRELDDFRAGAAAPAAPPRLPPSTGPTPKVAAADDRRTCSEVAERRLEEMDGAGEDNAFSLSPAANPKPFPVSVVVGDTCDACDACSKSAKLSCEEGRGWGWGWGWGHRGFYGTILLTLRDIYTAGQAIKVTPYKPVYFVHSMDCSRRQQARSSTAVSPNSNS